MLRITLQTKQTEAAVEDIRAQYRSTVIEEIVPTEETEKEEVSQSVGLQALRDKNHDCVGWITIAGTRVDYPVMQSSVKDAERYLRRNFQGEYDINGLPFLDARCTVTPASQNLIVYGHNLHTGVMFHDLLSYK